MHNYSASVGLSGVHSRESLFESDSLNTKKTHLGINTATSALSKTCSSANTCDVDTPTITPNSTMERRGEEKRLAKRDESRARTNVTLTPEFKTSLELDVELSIVNDTVPLNGSSINRMLGFVEVVLSVVTVRVSLLAELEYTFTSPCGVDRVQYYRH